MQKKRKNEAKTEKNYLRLSYTLKTRNLLRSVFANAKCLCFLCFVYALKLIDLLIFLLYLSKRLRNE